MTNVMERPTSLGTQQTRRVEEDRLLDAHRDADLRADHRGVGLFPASALGGPMFESKDIAAFIAAAIIALGPLAAYSFGFGA